MKRSIVFLLGLDRMLVHCRLPHSVIRRKKEPKSRFVGAAGIRHHPLEVLLSEILLQTYFVSDFKPSFTFKHTRMCQTKNAIR